MQLDIEIHLEKLFNSDVKFFVIYDNSTALKGAGNDQPN